MTFLKNVHFLKIKNKQNLMGLRNFEFISGHTPVYDSVTPFYKFRN